MPPSPANISVAPYGAMAHYNRWINQRLYALIENIPDTQRKANMGAHFGSIHATLSHLVWADRIWLARFTDQPIPESQPWGADLFPEFTDLMASRFAVDDQIHLWVQSLHPEDLERVLTLRAISNGKIRRGPLWVFVTHFFNHQTHHRGQITTLLRQLGYDPGVMDLPAMPGLLETS